MTICWILYHGSKQMKNHDQSITVLRIYWNLRRISQLIIKNNLLGTSMPRSKRKVKDIGKKSNMLFNSLLKPKKNKSKQENFEFSILFWSGIASEYDHAALPKFFR